MQNHLVSGILFNGKAAMITLLHLPNRPDVEGKILNVVSIADIEVDMIAESVTDKGKNLTFSIERQDYKKTLSVIQKLFAGEPNALIESATDVAKLSLTGIGMRSHAGVTYHMFKTLSEKDIRIRMITTSETKISIIIDEKDVEQAIAALHDEFELKKNSNGKSAFMEM
jgi:aspartate kinase